MAGGFLTGHGGVRAVRYKVLFGGAWCMDTLCLLRNIYEDVLVRRLALLQSSLEFFPSNLGNTCV